MEADTQKLDSSAGISLLRRRSNGEIAKADASAQRFLDNSTDALNRDGRTMFHYENCLELCENALECFEGVNSTQDELLAERERELKAREAALQEREAKVQSKWRQMQVLDNFFSYQNEVYMTNRLGDAPTWSEMRSTYLDMLDEAYAKHAAVATPQHESFANNSHRITLSNTTTVDGAGQTSQAPYNKKPPSGLTHLLPQEKEKAKHTKCGCDALIYDPPTMRYEEVVWGTSTALQVPLSPKRQLDMMDETSTQLATSPSHSRRISPSLTAATRTASP